MAGIEISSSDPFNVKRPVFDNAEHALAYIKEELTNMLNKRQFRHISDTIHEIDQTVKLILLANRVFVQGDMDYIKYDISQENLETINIIPLNLFTFLLLRGIYVPYNIIKDSNEYATDHGTYKFEYNIDVPRDSKCTLIPNKTIKFETEIKIDKTENTIK